jgi:hypothetical protein
MRECIDLENDDNLPDQMSPELRAQIAKPVNPMSTNFVGMLNPDIQSLIQTTNASLFQISWKIGMKHSDWDSFDDSFSSMIYA